MYFTAMQNISTPTNRYNLYHSIKNLKKNHLKWINSTPFIKHNVKNVANLEKSNKVIPEIIEKRKLTPIKKHSFMTDTPNYKKSQREALNLLDKFGYKSPAIDPTTICRDLGIRVYFADFTGEDDNISGFFYGEKNEIYVNEKEYPQRQTFTIAHELGHKIMHEEWLNSSDYKVLLRNSLNDSDDPKEKEANCFAANLLVPKFMLDKYHKIASIEELATLFMVSVPVIRARIQFEYNK